MTGIRDMKRRQFPMAYARKPRSLVRMRCAGVSIIWAFQKAGKDGAAGLFWTSGKPDAHGIRLMLPSRERLREGGHPGHASCRLSRLVASEEDLQIFKEVNGPLIVPGLMMKQP